MTADVVNIADVLAARRGKDIFNASVRHSLRAAVAHVAELYDDVQGDAWIDRKSEIAEQIFKDMIDATTSDIEISLPAALPADVDADIRTAVVTAVQRHSELCLRAFASHLIDLLRP